MTNSAITPEVIESRGMSSEEYKKQTKYKPYIFCDSSGANDFGF